MGMCGRSYSKLLTHFWIYAKIILVLRTAIGLLPLLSGVMKDQFWNPLSIHCLKALSLFCFFLVVVLSMLNLRLFEWWATHNTINWITNYSVFSSMWSTHLHIIIVVVTIIAINFRSRVWLMHLWMCGYCMAWKGNLASVIMLHFSHWPNFYKGEIRKRLFVDKMQFWVGFEQEWVPHHIKDSTLSGNLNEQPWSLSHAGAWIS